MEINGVGPTLVQIFIFLCLLGTLIGGAIMVYCLVKKQKKIDYHDQRTLLGVNDSSMFEGWPGTILVIAALFLALYSQIAGTEHFTPFKIVVIACLSLSIVVNFIRGIREYRGKKE
ncbi:hypothetical protein J2Z48_000787 [Croceifilum oryzae]|uniref:DUF3784 domain-containing protein n=1 Tax=Croceifilum oryzae TaxID=1553429 RepID=A0AAJ1WRI5_9BACL|nr:hypothetical protein [Croceifilum oryzae]MDQ0416620.1 hypothetical protein [Croceifilum oryzae]